MFLRFWSSGVMWFTFLATAPQDNLSGLKPSTLKQLGQPVPPTTANQVNLCPLTDKNIEVDV